MIRGDLARLLRDLSKGELPWPLFLFGSAGSGKTCAALSLADYVPSAVYFATRELVRQTALLARGELCNSLGYTMGYETFWKKVSDTELGILDEIGSREKVSDHHYESVMEFLDRRSQKPAIYISNLSVQQIADLYDDRIASRLTAGTIYQHEEGDMRNEHNFAQQG